MAVPQPVWRYLPPIFNSNAARGFSDDFQDHGAVKSPRSLFAFPVPRPRLKHIIRCLRTFFPQQLQFLPGSRAEWYRTQFLAFAENINLPTTWSSFHIFPLQVAQFGYSHAARIEQTQQAMITPVRLHINHLQHQIFINDTLVEIALHLRHAYGCSDIDWYESSSVQIGEKRFDAGNGPFARVWRSLQTHSKLNHLITYDRFKRCGADKLHEHLHIVHICAPGMRTAFKQPLVHQPGQTGFLLFQHIPDGRKW